jgi:hypothetical protein
LAAAGRDMAPRTSLRIIACIRPMPPFASKVSLRPVGTMLSCIRPCRALAVPACLCRVMAYCHAAPARRPALLLPLLPWQHLCSSRRVRCSSYAALSSVYIWVRGVGYSGVPSSKWWQTCRTLTPQADGRVEVSTQTDQAYTVSHDCYMCLWECLWARGRTFRRDLLCSSRAQQDNRGQRATSQLCIAACEERSRKSPHAPKSLPDHDR